MTSLIAAASAAQPSTAVSLMAIEYVTRDLFKGKSLRMAAKTFCSKFNGQSNIFLGRVNHSIEEVMQAVLEDKAKLAIAGAARMKPGNAEIAIMGTAKQFNLTPAELGREVAAIVARSASMELIETRDTFALAVGLLNAAHPEARKSQPDDADDADDPDMPDEEEWEAVREAFGLDGSFRYSDEQVREYTRMFRAQPDGSDAAVTQDAPR